MELFVIKLSMMIQNDEVEVDIRSNPNFYTLKGCRFTNGKLMTSNHTEVTNKTISTQRIIRHPIYQILEGTLFGQRAIHNLHFKLSIPNFYNAVQNNQDFRKNINKRNKGIQLNYTDIYNFTIIITIYPNNTCNIVIGCSDNPILLDFKGINKLCYYSL